MAFEGTERVYALAADLSRAGAEIVPKAEQVVAKTALDITAWAQDIVAWRTGNLHNSIGADIDGLTAIIGPAAMYGGFVEKGTRFMEAQPYLSTAAVFVEPSFIAAMEQLGGDIF